ncbi:MAG: hypothetical protein ACLFMO_06935 [Eubacteriales bacterium]
MLETYYWDLFEETGSIEAYISYAQIRNHHKERDAVKREKREVFLKKEAK